MNTRILRETLEILEKYGDLEIYGGYDQEIGIELNPISIPLPDDDKNKLLQLGWRYRCFNNGELHQWITFGGYS
jgi:hypothetical protein